MLGENFYESEIRDHFKRLFDSGELRSIGGSLEIFQKIAGVYPVVGSKIDWNRVPRSVGCAESRDDFQIERFVGFFNEVIAKFSLSGGVIYVGDGLTDFALIGDISVIQKILPKLIEIPQHHYIVDYGCSWCICLTMEGDMDFGFAS
jgi:hypothetical protein